MKVLIAMVLALLGAHALSPPAKAHTGQSGHDNCIVEKTEAIDGVGIVAQKTEAIDGVGIVAQDTHNDLRGVEISTGIFFYAKAAGFNARLTDEPCDPGSPADNAGSPAIWSTSATTFEGMRYQPMSPWRDLLRQLET